MRAFLLPFSQDRTITFPMKRETPTFAGLILLFLLNGCVTVDPVLEDPETKHRLDALFVDVEVGDPETGILQLSDEMKQQLEERVDPAWGDARKFLQLGEYFFNSDERDIQYDAWSTSTAEETFITGRGNCLSMSILFVAAARHLKFDGRFETVEVKPSWTHEGETMIRYEHIVATGNLGSSIYSVDFLPQFIGERGPRTRVTDDQALALYYGNLAVEAIVTEDLDLGIYKSLQALKLWPENSNAWSNLGTAYRRKGESELAEASYRRALALNRDNYSALSNLTQFYLMEDRGEEANIYLRTVSRYYRRNPYYHLQVARMQVQAGDVVGARTNLERATRLKKNDPVLYDALSDIYEKLNDQEASTKHAGRAEKLRQSAGKLQEQEMLSPDQLR